MRRRENTRRTATAIAVSTVFHVVILALLLTQVTPDYQLPETPAPPMDVRITPMPEPPPPIVVVPVLKPKPQPPKPAPVKPEPPKPEPAKPQPTPAPPPTPQPSRPEPPKPQPPAPVAPAPPKLAPTPPKPAPAVAATPAPVAPPRPEAKPTPAVAPTPPAPQTPRAPPAPPSPAVAPAPMRMNIHKPDKEAPASVATLPFAPAPTPAAAPGAPKAAPPPAGGEPALGGSRLTGLTPYPYGTMPGGGAGLRGTLVGCANADAVSLSSVERARCNERFGGSIGAAPNLDPLSPGKRAAFDKAADQDEAGRRYRDSAGGSGPPRPLTSSPGDTSRGPSSVIGSSPH